MLFCLITVGCTRKDYRLWADRDAQCLIESRQRQQPWQIPARTVEPVAESRMADINDPDCPDVRPGDDPSAASYMHCSYRFTGSNYWDRFSPVSEIDHDHWRSELPVDENGVINVDRDMAIKLSLLHNRQYQSQYESLYLTALGQSLNRYDFHARWFGNSGSTFSASGDGALASRLISESRGLGFRRNLVGGGQFLTSLANSFSWQLGGGPNTQNAASSVLFALTQPLMRGAFRHVRMESLTQGERSLLYSVRDFVRFRRQFYLDTVQPYLQLLLTVQSLKNQRKNLVSLENNLLEHEELLRLGSVSPNQVDQVLQSYQSGRISILSSEQGLQDALDGFKFSLGLPSDIEVKLDESILQPFELTDPRLDQAQVDTTTLFKNLVQYLPPEDTPPQDLLDNSFADLLQLIGVAQELLPTIASELEQWQTLVDETDESVLDNESRIDFASQKTLLQRLRRDLVELEEQLPKDLQDAEKGMAEMAQKTPAENWDVLEELIGQRLRDRIATLFVIQNQVRLFLIELPEFDLTMERAVEIALENRLDLMNERAQVTDAFRQVEIAANQLQSDVTVSASATLATDPAGDNPVRFDSSANSYQLSAQFDGPLDRYSERNGYRATQIAYQRQRRQYMASEDSIRNQLRSSIRQITINRLNFQIARQQLITATRQVENTQLTVRQSQDPRSNLTNDLLNALQGLLGARNSLISSWINYEISRISLFVQMELLQLDENGNWINERYNPWSKTNERALDNQRPPFSDERERGPAADASSGIEPDRPASELPKTNR